jgi:hypothetical protein
MTHVDLSPRLAAGLLALRLGERRLSPVARAARRHERAFQRWFRAAVRRAQEATNIAELVEALGLPGTGAVMHVVQPVVEDFLGPVDVSVPGAVHPYFRVSAAASGEQVIVGALKAGALAEDVCVPTVNLPVFDKSRYRNFDDFNLETGELGKKGRTLARNWHVSDEQRDSILTYMQDVSYTEINTLLRSGRLVAGSEMNATTIQTHVAKIDGALAKGGLARPTQFYRGIQDDSGFFANLKVGDIFVDKGYTSTTISEAVAYNHGDEIVEVLVPRYYSKGGGYIEKLRDDLIGRGDPFASNYEYLLPRDTKFEVVEKTAEGRLTLHVRE